LLEVCRNRTRNAQRCKHAAASHHLTFVVAARNVDYTQR